MTSKPRTVLVGIVTHNRAVILPKAIASVLKQRGCEVRVSVIDDGSTDDTPDLARLFPGVEWIRWEPNRGYMAARNHWMSTAKEDYFVSLDDDAWFINDDEIAQAVAYLERHPAVAAVAYDILSPDRPQPVERSTPHPVGVFIGCGHMLRVALLHSVGVYEKTPGSYGGEEKDLCLRFMHHGFQVVGMPGVHVWHEKSALARDMPAQHRSGVCNDLVMTLRRAPLLLMPLALINKMCRHLNYAWQHGLMRPCLEGLLMCALALPQVFWTRRPVSIAALRAFMKLSRTSPEGTAFIDKPASNSRAK